MGCLIQYDGRYNELTGTMGWSVQWVYSWNIGLTGTQGWLVQWDGRCHVLAGIMVVDTMGGWCSGVTGTLGRLALGFLALCGG